MAKTLNSLRLIHANRAAGCIFASLHEWMNEWCIYIALLLCIAIHPKRFTIMWGVTPQPPPVCSIHLDDATAATGQRRQCTHHTPATGGEEREIEPIKWMGIIRRPWLTRTSGGKFGQDTGVTPLLFTMSVMGFLMTTESGHRFNVSSERRCFLQYSVPITILGHWDPHRPQGEHPLLASLTPLPSAT